VRLSSWCIGVSFFLRVPVHLCVSLRDRKVTVSDYYVTPHLVASSQWLKEIVLANCTVSWQTTWCEICVIERLEPAIAGICDVINWLQMLAVDWRFFLLTQPAIASCEHSITPEIHVNTDNRKSINKFSDKIFNNSVRFRRYANAQEATKQAHSENQKLHLFLYHYLLTKMYLLADDKLCRSHPCNVETNDALWRSNTHGSTCCAVV